MVIRPRQENERQFVWPLDRRGLPALRSAREVRGAPPAELEVEGRMFDAMDPAVPTPRGVVTVYVERGFRLRQFPLPWRAL